MNKLKKYRQFLCSLLLILLPLCALRAQEEELRTFAFPVSLLLEEYAGAGCWQPDWPPDFPPDAFRNVTGALVPAAVQYRGREYCLLYEDQLLVEFPWCYNGELIQTRLVYPPMESPAEEPLSENGKARFPVKLFPGGLADIEILRFEYGYPSLLRIYREGSYFFVTIVRSETWMAESWFDPQGVFLEQYGYVLMPENNIPRIRSYLSVEGRGERRSFDSRALITGINGDHGEFSVHYFMDYYPRYWKRNAVYAYEQNLIFQWDEAGFLVRLYGGDDDEPVDCRYEYTLDDNGDWIERREIRMIRHRDLLAASEGFTVTRVLGKP